MNIIDSGASLAWSLQQQLAQWLHIPGWILLPGLLLLGAVIIDLVILYLMRRLEHRLQESSRRWDDPLIHGLRVPLRIWIWLTALIVSIGVAGSHFGVTAMARYLSLIGALVTLLLVAWGGIRLLRRLEQRLVFPPASCHAKPVDATSASAVTKIGGAALIVTVALIGLQLLGVSMSSILAMGGFGGLVIGFAARDVMANFFGGMVVHLDKPFVVGDWIRSPERQIEGIVEDIGWRLTTIRTFAGPPLYVPNSWFSQISVETPTRMHSRRLWEKVGIRYRDADAIEGITGSIRKMLSEHDEIDQEELITINFVHYGDYSLEIMLYAFTGVTDWQRFHEIKQAILLKVRDIIHEHGAELALPMSQLYMPEGVTVHGGSAGETGNGEDSDAAQTDNPSRDRRPPRRGESGPEEQEQGESDA